MGECGIYEDGHFNSASTPADDKFQEKGHEINVISGYSDLECIADQSQPNLRIGRDERTNHSTKSVAGYVSKSQDRLSG